MRSRSSELVSTGGVPETGGVETSFHRSGTIIVSASVFLFTNIVVFTAS